MSIDRKIRVLTILMCFSNLGNLVYLNFAEPLGFQLAFLAPIILLSFLVIYFFYCGRNWARILILIGAGFGLLNFPSVLAVKNLFQAALCLGDGVFSIYLLAFLNRKEARAFFKKAAPTQGLAPQPKGKGRFIKILLIIGIILTVLCGAAAFGIRSFLKSIQNSQIYLEDVESGVVTAITDDNMNSHPKFSSDGSKIAFVSRKDSQGKQGSSLKIYSLADRSTSVVFEDKDLILSPSWGFENQSIAFSRRLNGQRDLWLYSFPDGVLNRITNDKAEESNPILSPDGQQILFDQKDTDEKTILYVLPLKGGAKQAVTEGTDFLHEPQYPAWSPDSLKIAYVSFIDLVIHNVTTGQKEVVSLAGLNNFMGLLFYPLDPDLILIKARPAESFSFQTNLYLVSRLGYRIEIWKPGRSMMELNYDVSPDGKKLVYARLGSNVPARA